MLLPRSGTSGWGSGQWPFVSKLFCCVWPLLKPVAISMVPSVIQNKTWGQTEPDGGMSVLWTTSSNINFCLECVESLHFRPFNECF